MIKTNKMKIIKRIVFIIIGLLSLPIVVIEVPFYAIRWIFTGKPFPTYPLCISILIGEWRSYFSGEYY
jgi:hypothetical protein